MAAAVRVSRSAGARVWRGWENGCLHLFKVENVGMLVVWGNLRKRRRTWQVHVGEKPRRNTEASRFEADTAGFGPQHLSVPVPFYGQ